MKCHADGELRPVERAVSALDRGLVYGDAATERLRAVAGEPFRWAAHRERLTASCDSLGIEPPGDLCERIVETLTANELSDALVRVSITRGELSGGRSGTAIGGATGRGDVGGGSHDDRATDGLTPPPDPDPTVLITAEPVAPIQQAGSEPATLQTVKTRQIPTDAIPRRAQSHCRLDRVLARRELVGDADEALMLTRQGTVAGCAGSALLVVDEDSIRVPPTPEAVVPQVMRTVALECAREEGIPVAVDDLVPAAVRGAEEVLLANARWGLRRVGTVDGIDIDPGPVTALLDQLLAGEIADAVAR